MNNNLKFNINVSDIASQFGDVKESLERYLMSAVGGLATATHAKTLEFASDKLGSSLQDIYKKALSFEQIQQGIWIVSLDESAMWIEEGRKSGFQEELLRGKSSKVGKDGQRYAVIPFKQDKTPSQVSGQSLEILNSLKSELKRRNIPLRKLELNEQGSPRLGRLHTFDIQSRRTVNKAGIESKYEALHGVSIYQRKNDQGVVKRDIMTFRIITEKHRSEGRWVHPGLPPANILDQSFNWAVNTWENQILPQILSGLEKG